MWEKGVVLPVLLTLVVLSYPLAHLADRAPGWEAQAQYRVSLPKVTSIGLTDLEVRTEVVRLSFGPPEPILDDEGRLIGLSVEGCDYIRPLGQLLLPVKILVFELGDGEEFLGLDFKVGEMRVFPLSSYELGPGFRPAPIGRPDHAQPCRPVALDRPWPWITYRLHYGLDPFELERKRFLVIHIYPIQYGPGGHELLWISSVELIIRFEEGRGSVGLSRGGPPKALMMVITNEELLPAAEELASLKNATGISTVVRTVEWIDGHYGGRDLQEKIRNCIINAVEELGIIFVLILGDHDVVPARLVYIPDGVEDTVEAEDGSLVETDLYYADVLPSNLTWNDDGDSLWGELPDEQIDMLPDVLLGRLPASSLEEAMLLLGKLENYTNAVCSSENEWFFKAILAGTDLFLEYAGPEGEIVKAEVASRLSSKFRCIRLYETAGNLTRSSLISHISRGCGLLNFVGHGDPDAWFLGGMEIFFSSDVAYLGNKAKLPVIIAAACSTARFSDRDCIAEALLLEEDGGAIAYLGSTRVAWMPVSYGAPTALAGLIDVLFSEAFSRGPVLLGQAWAYAITNYTLSSPVYEPDPYTGYYLDWKTVAEYGTLLGDPSLTFYNATGTYDLIVKCTDADGEHPMEGIEVRLSFMGTLMAQNITNQDGLVEFKGLVPGVYELNFSFMGLKVAGPKKVFVPRPGKLVVRCYFLDLEFYVTDAGGEPLFGVLIVLENEELGLEFRGTSDQDGIARIEDVPMLNYSLKAYWDKPFRTEVFSGYVYPLEDEFRVELACSVLDATIVVVDLWGRPIPAALVEVKTPNGTEVGSFRTNENGHVRLEDLAPGHYRARISAPLSLGAEVAFDLREQGQVIEVKLLKPFSHVELYLIFAFSAAALLVALRKFIYRVPQPGSY